MVPLYVIHATNKKNGNVGYIGNKTTYDANDCNIQLLKEDDIDRSADQIVAYFSKRRANEIKNELTTSALRRYPNADIEFKVVEHHFSYDDVDVIRNRTPFADGRK